MFQMNFGVACKQISEANDDDYHDLTMEELEQLHDQSHQCFETAYVMSLNLVDTMTATIMTRLDCNNNNGTPTTTEAKRIKQMFIQSLMVLMFTTSHMCNQMCDVNGNDTEVTRYYNQIITTKVCRDRLAIAKTESRKSHRVIKRTTISKKPIG
jgi:hypothetical protein